jgi:hypothetical protein
MVEVRVRIACGTAVEVRVRIACGTATAMTSVDYRSFQGGDLWRVVRWWGGGAGGAEAESREEEDGHRGRMDQRRKKIRVR